MHIRCELDAVTIIPLCLCMAVLASLLQAQKVPEGDACHHENTQIEAFWHTLSPQERTDMLTITLDEFWAKLLDKTNEGEQLDTLEHSYDTCFCPGTSSTP